MFIQFFIQFNLQLHIIQLNMTSNYSQIVSTVFFPDQNHPKNSKTPKSSQIDSCRLAGVHHHQTVHTNQKTGCNRQVSPSGQNHAVRRFLFRNPETTQKCMSRLAAIHHPPGGFWKISEIRNSSQDRGCSCIIIIYIIQLIVNIKKIMRFNSPDLVSLLRLENSKVLLYQQWFLLLSPPFSSLSHSLAQFSLRTLSPFCEQQWQRSTSLFSLLIPSLIRS